MAPPVKLMTPEAFDRVLAESHERPVAVMKHSTACGLSARAIREFEACCDGLPASCYVVVVQQAREASNHVADVTGIRHDTPQVLVLSAGRVTYHTSHSRIRRSDLRRAVEDAAAHTTE